MLAGREGLKMGEVHFFPLASADGAVFKKASAISCTDRDKR